MATRARHAVHQQHGGGAEYDRALPHRRRPRLHVEVVRPVLRVRGLAQHVVHERREPGRDDVPDHRQLRADQGEGRHGRLPDQVPHAEAEQVLHADGGLDEVQRRQRNRKLIAANDQFTPRERLEKQGWAVPQDVWPPLTVYNNGTHIDRAIERRKNPLTSEYDGVAGGVSGPGNGGNLY